MLLKIYKIQVVKQYGNIICKAHKTRLLLQKNKILIIPI